jgi:hypothetical protein
MRTRLTLGVTRTLWDRDNESDASTAPDPYLPAYSTRRLRESA